MALSALDRIGLGTAPLGNLFAALSDEQAQGTVDAAWEAGVRFFDTAPLYGHGLAEVRLGRALASRPRHEYVLATKVGRLLRHTDGARPDTIFRDAAHSFCAFDDRASYLIEKSAQEEWYNLGHRTMGMRLLQSEERTRYLGTHHMDCIVRVNGQVYAARRVPVTIRDVQHHVQAPAKPSYTRLRMKRRR